MKKTSILIAIFLVICLFFLGSAITGFILYKPNVITTEHFQLSLTGEGQYVYEIKNLHTEPVENIIAAVTLPAGSIIEDAGSATIEQTSNYVSLTWFLDRIDPEQTQTINFKAEPFSGQVALSVDGLTKEFKTETLQAWQTDISPEEFLYFDLEPKGYLTAIFITLDIVSEGQTNFKLFIDQDGQKNGNEELLGEQDFVANWSGVISKTFSEENYTSPSLVFYSTSQAKIKINKIDLIWGSSKTISESGVIEVAKPAEVKAKPAEVKEEVEHAKVKVSLSAVDAKGQVVKGKIKLLKDGELISSEQTELEAGEYDIEFEPEEHAVKKISFNKVNLTKDTAELVELDDVPETIEGLENITWKEVYAVNPLVDFESAEINAIAKGNILYKCKDWDFETQKCLGTWEKLIDLTPGQPYSFTITAGDPAFAEGELFGVPEEKLPEAKPQIERMKEEERPPYKKPEIFYVNGISYAKPQIYRPAHLDKNDNGITDSLEDKISKKPQEDANIIVTTYEPVEQADLDKFTSLGGKIKYVYKWAGYGYAGTIKANKISSLQTELGSNLCIMEEDLQLEMYSDKSMQIIAARPVVWQTYGFNGSANNSLASLDTGVDTTHPDTYGYVNASSAGWAAVYNNKTVGWYDVFGENATPVAVQSHGEHTSSIAVGTGNSYGSGTINNLTVTWEGTTPSSSPGAYIQKYNITSPGNLTINYSVATIGNKTVECYFPNDTQMVNISGNRYGTAEPLVVVFNATEAGIYQCNLGINDANLVSKLFSALITFPYTNVGDGYNLFTGVAPENKLVMVKIMNNSGSGTTSDMQAGYDWVIANKAEYHIKAATTAIGLSADDATTNQKINNIVANGIPVTDSAGNGFCLSTERKVVSPGSASKVITVGSTNYYNQVSYYSSNGASGSGKPDVVAPGGGSLGPTVCSADANDNDASNSTFSDRKANDTGYFMGGSAAVSHGAGLLALMVQAWENATGQPWEYKEENALKLKQIMEMTAWETNQEGEYCSARAANNTPTLDRGGKDLKEGFGRINADAAIEALTMSYTINSSASGTLTAGQIGKKVWARKVQLEANKLYNFTLAVPDGADFDLYVYHKDYNSRSASIGDPFYKRSASATIGGTEKIMAPISSSGTYYIVVKQVSGSGDFTLSSTEQPVVHSVTTWISGSYIYAESEHYKLAALNDTAWTDFGLLEQTAISKDYDPSQHLSGDYIFEPIYFYKSAPAGYHLIGAADAGNGGVNGIVVEDGPERVVLKFTYTDTGLELYHYFYNDYWATRVKTTAFAGTADDGLRARIITYDSNTSASGIDSYGLHYAEGPKYTNNTWSTTSNVSYDVFDLSTTATTWAAWFGNLTFGAVVNKVPSNAIEYISVIYDMESTGSDYIDYEHDGTAANFLDNYDELIHTGYLGQGNSSTTIQNIKKVYDNPAKLACVVNCSAISFNSKQFINAITSSTASGNDVRFNVTGNTSWGNSEEKLYFIVYNVTNNNYVYRSTNGNAWTLLKKIAAVQYETNNTRYNAIFSDTAPRDSTVWYRLDVDIIPPKWSANQSSIPATYDPNTRSYFNITWSDDEDGANTTAVALESNFTGSGYNNSMNLISGDSASGIYSFNDTLPAGNFYWKSYAKDKATAPNWNSTDKWEFTIARASRSCTLTLSPASGITYGTQTTANCSCTNSEDGTIKLWRNNSDVTAENGTVVTLPAGVWDYVCNITQTQNYTSASDSAQYSVNKAGTETYLWLNSTAGNKIYKRYSIANLTAQVNTTGLAVNISANFSGWVEPTGTGTVYNTTNLTDSDGVYNITGYFGGNQNYTGSNQTHWLTIDGTAPKWNDTAGYLGSNTTTPTPGAAVLLYAMGKDNLGLDFAWLATNETGVWQNKTQNYSSPMDMGDATTWSWSNFTWMNSSVAAGTPIGWRIYYNDTAGNENVTSEMTFTVQVTCQNLTSPNTVYTLNQNLSGTQASGRCLDIQAPNITLDCAGWNLTGTGSGHAIHSNSSNATIRNCIITTYLDGIFLVSSSNNNTLINNTVTNSSDGIFLGSNNNTLINNTVNNNINNGISLSSSSNNNITNNTANSNGDTGIFLDSSSNNNITNNTANNNSRGINIMFGSSNTLINNIVSNNSDVGLRFSSSSNTLTNNTANSNNYGIYLSSSSSNSILTNNIANNNINNGITLFSSSNTLTNNTANNNSYDGIYLYSSSSNTITNNIANNNTWDFWSEGSSINNTVTNLTSWQNLVSFTSQDIALKGLQTAPPTTAYYNISKYVNATNNSVDSWLYLNISYADPEDIPAGADKNKLRLYRHTGTSWELVTGVNGVDTTVKYVYANITSFSTFAPLAAANTAPEWYWTGVTQTSPANDSAYQPGLKTFQINITDDELNVQTVFFYYNNTLIDRTGTNTTPDVWQAQADLGAGLWNISWWFNDTEGLSNSTEFYYNINKAGTEIKLYKNASEWTVDAAITYPEAVNINATINVSSLQASLLQNGSARSNADIVQLAARTYNYTGYYDGNENYTASSNTKYLTVNKADPSANLKLAFNETESDVTNTYPESVNATGWCNLTNNQDLTFGLYRNNVNISLGGDPDSENILLGNGTYIYIYNNTAGENYSSGSITRTYKVLKGSPVLNVYIDDVASDKTIAYPTIATVKGNETNTGDSDVTYELWRDGTSLGTGSSVSDSTRLGNATYTIKYNSTTGTNWTSNSNPLTLKVLKGTVQPTLSSNVSWSTTYPTATNTSCSVTSQNNEVICLLWRNETSVSNPDEILLGAGNYVYKTNTSGTGNYTANNTGASETLTINKADPTSGMSVSGTSPIYYETASGWQGTETNTGDNDCTYTLARNGTDVSNPDTTVLPAESFNYTYYVTGCTNYTDGQVEDTLTVNQKNANVQVYPITQSKTYPSTTVTQYCTDDSSLLNCKIYRDDVEITNDTDYSPGYGTYTYKANITDQTNYTNYEDTETLTVNKGVLSGTVSITPSNLETYPTETTASYSETNIGGGDVNYYLFRDNLDASPSETNTLGAGTYNYKLNSTGGTNWTANSSIATDTLTISQNNTNPVDLYLNGTLNSNKTYTYPESINATAKAVYTNSGTLHLWRAGTDYAPTEEIRLGNNTHAYKVNITGNTNYTSNDIGLTYFAFVNKGPTEIKLYLQDSESNASILYGIQSNATATLNVSGEIFYLYRDGFPLTGTDLISEIEILPANTHNYTAFWSGNENYTGDSKTYWLQINKTSPTIHLYLNGIEDNQSLIYEQATNATGFTEAGDSVINQKLLRDGNEVATGSLAAEEILLGNGTYNYTYYYSESENYTSGSTTRFVFVNKKSLPVYISFNGSVNQNKTYTYEELTNATGYKQATLNNEGSLILYRDGNVIAGNAETVRLGNNTYNYTLDFTATNYTNNKTTYYVLVNQKLISLYLALNGTQDNRTYVYPESVNASAWSDQRINNEGTQYLFRDQFNIGALEENILPAAGTYEYKTNFTASNYSAPEIIRYANVSQGPTLIRLFLNGTEGDKNYGQYEIANFTVTLNVTNKTVYLDTNLTGWAIQSNSTPLYNETNLTELGQFNITGYFLGEQNYSASSRTYFINVSDITPPAISNPSPANNSELAAGTTSVLLGADTNELAVCRYNSYNGTAFLNMTNFTATNSTKHNSTISVSVGAYNYYIKCNDSYGNTNPADYLIHFSVKEAAVAVGAAGGGAPAGGGPPPVIFNLSLEQIIESVNLTEHVIRELWIKNEGTETIDVNISVEGDVRTQISLDKTRFSIKPNKNESVKIALSAGTVPAAYLGNIIVTADSKVKKIPIILLATTKEKALLDVKVEVLDKYKKVAPGEPVGAQITIFNLGTVKPLDVTLVYAITYGPTVLVSAQETLAVEMQTSIARWLTIPEGASTGKYGFAVSAMYDSVTTASTDTFDVIAPEEKIPTVPVIPILVAIIVAVLVAAIAVIIIKKPSIGFFVKSKERSILYNRINDLQKKLSELKAKGVGTGDLEKELETAKRNLKEGYMYIAKAHIHKVEKELK